MTLKTGFLERGVDIRLSRKGAREGLQNDALPMIKNLLELPNAADEDRFFEAGSPVDFLTLLLHQRLQAGPFTERAGGSGLASTVP